MSSDTVTHDFDALAPETFDSIRGLITLHSTLVPPEQVGLGGRGQRGGRERGAVGILARGRACPSPLARAGLGRDVHAGRVRVQEPLPWPMSTPLFFGLSALVFAGASIALTSGSRVGTVFGWMMLGLPFAVFATGYDNAGRNLLALSRDAGWLVSGLGVAAFGVVVLSFMQQRTGGTRDLPGLEGVDVVEELFAQVERTERAEARVAELERQFGARTRQLTGEQRAVRRVR